jgi:hypothetical protein
MSLKGAKVRRTEEGSFVVLDLIQISSRRRGGGNVGIGAFDSQGLWESRRGRFPRRLFHGPPFPRPSFRFHPVGRSFSNSLLFACCMRRAASVSLRAPAMRFKALMLSPWRKYCAGLSSANKVSSGVW